MFNNKLLNIQWKLLQVNIRIVIWLFDVLFSYLGHQTFNICLMISLAKLLSVGLLFALLILRRWIIVHSCRLTLVSHIICWLRINMFWRILNVFIGVCRGHVLGLLFAFAILALYSRFLWVMLLLSSTCCRMRCLILWLNKIIFVMQLLMKVRTMPWKFKVVSYFLGFKSCGDFLFENDKFVFHFRINIPLFLSWPESPKGIADNVSFLGLFFDAENVISKFHQNILSLNKLLLLFHFVFHLLFRQVLFWTGYILTQFGIFQYKSFLCNWLWLLMSRTSFVSFHWWINWLGIRSLMLLNLLWHLSLLSMVILHRSFHWVSHRRRLLLFNILIVSVFKRILVLEFFHFLLLIILLLISPILCFL